METHWYLQLRNFSYRINQGFQIIFQIIITNFWRRERMATFASNSANKQLFTAFIFATLKAVDQVVMIIIHRR